MADSCNGSRDDLHAQMSVLTWRQTLTSEPFNYRVIYFYSMHPHILPQERNYVMSSTFGFALRLVVDRFFWLSLIFAFSLKITTNYNNREAKKVLTSDNCFCTI
jgi:hypothetical protein